MDSTRQNKVSRLLLKEMSEIFEFEVRGMMQGALVTITKVNVTKDLSVARFYLSIFAVKEKHKLLDEIRQHGPELRYRLGNRIAKQVRIIPHLEFFEDDSLDYIENIEKLLKE
jgi:ribosome-binding factor A